MSAIIICNLIESGTETKGFDQRSILKNGKASTSLVKTEPRTSLVKTGKASTSLVKAGKARTEVKKMDLENTQSTEEKKWMQARETLMKRLNEYRSYCKNLEEEKRKGKAHSRRVDCMAYDELKKKFPHLPKEPFLGSVPGIEIGQKFEFRLELHIVGLHRPTQGGIDTMEYRGNKVAISVVDSGGYAYDNYMSSTETLIYCAQGSSIEYS